MVHRNAEERWQARHSSQDATLDAQDFFNQFPDAHYLPRTHSVARLAVPDARHCLVHIRQLHDDQGVGEQDLRVIQAVQDDIHRILWSLEAWDDCPGGFYVEGQAVEQDVLHINTSDSAEEVALEFMTQFESVMRVDQLTMQYLESRFRDQYGHRGGEAIAIGIRHLRHILQDSDNKRWEQWMRIAEWRDEVVGHCRRVISKYSGESTLPDHMHVLGTVRLYAIGCSIVDERIAGENLQKLAKETMELLSKMRDYAIREDELRRKQQDSAIIERGQRIQYAVDRLHIEPKNSFALQGTESALINALASDIELDEDLMLEARERIILELISLRQQWGEIVLFGGAHDFVRQVERWNQEKPDDKFCLIEVTPKSYAEYIEGEDPSAAPENIEIRQPVLPRLELPIQSSAEFLYPQSLSVARMSGD